MFSVGYHHIDEHIQILEFAGLKLGMTLPSQLPWEYHYQIRPAFQPTMVVFLCRFFEVIGLTNPFIITLFLRLLSATLVFLAMHIMYKTYLGTIHNDKLKRWFLLLSFLLWFAIYIGVRFSSESWSGSLFIIAFSLLIIKPNPRMQRGFFIGLILGLSFLFRYQTGFLIAGLLFWNLFIRKEIKSTLFVTLGLLLMIGIGILSDRWFYGEWTLTTWNYFNQNIIQNKVSNFGIEPWWFYFSDVFVRAIPPFSIALILSFILLFIYKLKDALTWTLLPFLLIHFIIGHKETRFLFPIIGFVPIIVIKAIEIVQQKWHSVSLDNKYIKGFAKLFFIVNLLFVAVVAFKPANDQMSMFNKIYSSYNEPTVLYFIEYNPYKNIYFYKRPNLEIKEIKSVIEIELNSSKHHLIVTGDKNIIKELRMPKKLIYASYPDWVFNFNFNHWIERSNYWQVYELN